MTVAGFEKTKTRCCVAGRSSRLTALFRLVAQSGHRCICESLPVYIGLQRQHRLNDHLGALCCPEKCVDLDGQMARKSQPNCYTLMSILFLISLFFTRRFTGSSCIDSFVNKRPNSEAEATMKSRGSINKLALLLAVFIQVNSNKKWYNICRFRSRRHGKPIFWGKKNPFLFSLAKKK